MTTTKAVITGFLVRLMDVIFALKNESNITSKINDSLILFINLPPFYIAVNHRKILGISENMTLLQIYKKRNLNLGYYKTKLLRFWRTIYVGGYLISSIKVDIKRFCWRIQIVGKFADNTV